MPSPGGTFDQHVASAEQADEKLIDDIVVPDDDSPNRLTDPLQLFDLPLEVGEPFTIIGFLVGHTLTSVSHHPAG